MDMKSEYQSAMELTIERAAMTHDLGTWAGWVVIVLSVGYLSIRILPGIFAWRMP